MKLGKFSFKIGFINYKLNIPILWGACISVELNGGSGYILIPGWNTKTICLPFTNVVLHFPTRAQFHRAAKQRNLLSNIKQTTSQNAYILYESLAGNQINLYEIDPSAEASTASRKGRKRIYFGKRIYAFQTSSFQEICSYMYMYNWHVLTFLRKYWKLLEVCFNCLRLKQF